MGKVVHLVPEPRLRPMGSARHLTCEEWGPFIVNELGVVARDRPNNRAVLIPWHMVAVIDLGDVVLTSDAGGE